jgi:hypothetical protein
MKATAEPVRTPAALVQEFRQLRRPFHAVYG